MSEGGGHGAMNEAIERLIEESGCTGYPVYAEAPEAGAVKFIHHDGASCPVHEEQTTEGGAVVSVPFLAEVHVNVNLADRRVESLELVGVLDASAPEACPTGENEDRWDAAVSILAEEGWDWADHLSDGMELPLDNVERERAIEAIQRLER